MKMAEKECYQTRPECDDDDCSNCPIWLREELRKKDEEIERLNEECNRLHGEPFELIRKNRELEKQLADMQKELDYHNNIETEVE